MYDVGVMGNGALAGLVAITSGTSTIYPWGAIIVGGIAGSLYVFASWMSIKLKVRFLRCTPLLLCAVCHAGSTACLAYLEHELAVSCLYGPCCQACAVMHAAAIAPRISPHPPELTMTSVGLPSLDGSLSLEHSHQVLTWHADGQQLDDPLDAIAVHGWNGTWGVIAVGLFASETLITNSYGLDQSGNVRPYGCFFPGGNGALLAAQIAYALWIAGAHFARLPATQ